jgi:hypothetical protein
MCTGWVGGRRRRVVHWWRWRWRLRVAGRDCHHFFQRRVTGARGYGRAFGRWHLPPQRRPCLARGLRGRQLHGGGAFVQRRARRDEESSRCGGCVAGVGATARVCRMGWRCDRGGGGGRWNGVGRGRWGAEGRRRGLGGGAARHGGGGGSFSAGLFRACIDRCHALKPEPKF